MADSQESSTTRLSTSFHETLALNRHAIWQILQISRDSSGDFTFDTVRGETSMGRNYAKVMPRYAQGAGLLDSRRALTEFGELVVQNDDGLQRLETQWLMHYFLSSPLGPGPAFWHELMTSHLVVGSAITVDVVSSRIAQMRDSQDLAERTLDSTANVFLRSYSGGNGLQQIGLIAEESGQGVFRVEFPEPPPEGAFRFAVVEHWSRKWPDQQTVNLHELTEDLSPVFLMGEGQFGEGLRQMQRDGFIEIWRIAPPYQLMKKWTHVDQLRSMIYES